MTTIGDLKETLPVIWEFIQKVIAVLKDLFSNESADDSSETA